MLRSVIYIMRKLRPRAAVGVEAKQSLEVPVLGQKWGQDLYSGLGSSGYPELLSVFCPNHV